MDFDILITGGTIVNFDREYSSDIGIKGGKIVAIGKDLSKTHTKSSKKIIDASGKYVIPGGIDPHVHMELPFLDSFSRDDFFTGTKAALSGGTTMLIDFAQAKKGGSLKEIYDEYRKKADEKVCMDYALHLGLSSWNDETSEKEMEDLVKNHGINSFKFFMAYKGAMMVNDVEIMKILKCAKRLGAVAQVHAENGDMVEEGQKRLLKMGVTGVEGHPLSRPPIVEAEATARVCRLADFIGCPLYVVHIMSEEAMKEVSKAKLRGQRVIGETLACSLVLDDSVYYEEWEKAAKFVMSPPLRPKGNQLAIRKALKNKILDLVGTDHCVFGMDQRRLGRNDFSKIPNGNNGIEDRMNIVWTSMVESGMISRKDYVRITSTEAAQIFNIYPKKGFIGVGSDADIAIMNPKMEKIISAKTHHQNLEYNVFEGFKCNGVIDVTISRGKVVWENGKLNVEKGSGKFVPTPAFGKMFDGLEKEQKTFGDLAKIKKMRENQK